MSKNLNFEHPRSLLTEICSVFRKIASSCPSNFLTDDAVDFVD